MNKLITFSIAAIAISSACSVYAASTDGTQVNFTGSLVSSSCNVSVNDGQSTIDMGSIDTSTLAVGDTTAEVPFTVDISHCPTNVSSTMLDFQGTAFTGHPDVFSLTSAEGNAMDHIGMVLKDTKVGGYLSPNASSTSHDLVDGATSFPLAASMKLLQTGVDDGDFTVSTTLHVVYE